MGDRLIFPKKPVIRFVAIASFALATLLFPFRAYADSVSQICQSHPNAKMKIAITFDDGPHPIYTPRILDILRKYNAHATFFVIGENVAMHPDLTERCIAEGHEIANHTYTHKNLAKDSYSDIQSEIIHTENTVFENFDMRTKLLRPPGGLYDNNVTSAAARLDYTVILWSIDTRDWAHTPSDTIVEGVLDSVKAGDIILMHDFIQKDSPTPEALEKLLPILIDRGFCPVTVSELLGTE